MHKLLSKQIKASRERKWKKKVLLDAKKLMKESQQHLTFNKENCIGLHKRCNRKETLHGSKKTF